MNNYCITLVQDSSDTDDGIPPASPKEPSAEMQGNNRE